MSNTFDLLGTTPKKPSNLDLLGANQELIDKTVKAANKAKELNKLKSEFEQMKTEIEAESKRLIAMAKNYDSSHDSALYEILPENLNVKQLHRIAELFNTVTAQGFKIRLLRSSEPTENNWIAWGESPLKGMVALQLITHKIATDEYSRICVDVSGEATQTPGTTFLSIRLEGITSDLIEPSLLAQEKQLITLSSNTQDLRQAVSFRHAGIRLITAKSDETPSTLPGKLVFLLVQNDIEQVKAEIISAMLDPLKHLGLDLD